jgi:glutamate N-acetyltransferase/amino-acid N-acetyltransferase
MGVHLPQGADCWEESTMKFIEGGVCAAQGFRAAGIHVGVKTHASWKKDVALIVSDTDCAAAAVFTKNVVKAAPIHVDLAHLVDGHARAIIANSGNANACAPQGEENAERMCAAAAAAVGCRPEEVLVSSTGVIGQTLNVQVIEEGIPALYGQLAHSAAGSDDAAHAIMTTDTVKKEAAVETVIGGKTVRIGGIAKGSGMIHPNMGTMLCFLTTDCAISPAMIKSALLETVQVSFNRISVDGDTSTNDSCIVLANGLAGNPEITEKNGDYAAFAEALKLLCTALAKKMAADGEGAKHLITCTVTGAKDEEQAETIAKSVISSTLTKAAVFGADANWGRVLCAMGYSGAEFDPQRVDVSFASAAGEVAVCAAGRGLSFDEEKAKAVLTEHDVEIRIAIGEGGARCTCWGCDITYDYIKINGDYRT